MKYLVALLALFFALSCAQKESTENLNQDLNAEPTLTNDTGSDTTLTEPPVVEEKKATPQKAKKVQKSKKKKSTK